MFNVWLPAVLESKAGTGSDAIQKSLNEFVLYSSELCVLSNQYGALLIAASASAVAGCPGSVVSLSPVFSALMVDC